VNCDVCGEEIINEPEIRCESLNLCRAVVLPDQLREPKRVKPAALAELVA
jgi:hypothetical protein